jgi:hypothetical protein
MPLEIRPGSGAGDSGGGAPGGGGSGLSPDTVNGVYVSTDIAGPVVIPGGGGTDSLAPLLDNYTPVGDPEWASWNGTTHEVTISETGIYRIVSQHGISPPDPPDTASAFRTKGVWIEGGAWDILDNPPHHPYYGLEVTFADVAINTFTSQYVHEETEITYLAAGATVTLGYLVWYGTGDVNIYWGDLAIAKIG